MSELFETKPGDVVGICSENRLEFAVTVYATILLGATVAPVNVTYTECNVPLLMAIVQSMKGF